MRHFDTICFTRDPESATSAPPVPAHPFGPLAELADVACFQVDADRNVVALSPAMERLTGFRARQVLGRSCLTLHRCPECLKGCRVFQFGSVEDVRVSLYRSDGAELVVVKSGTALRDRRGRIVGALEVVRPVPAEELEERARIVSALERSKHRRAEAARILGISRSTLWRRMKEHGLA